MFDNRRWKTKFTRARQEVDPRATMNKRFYFWLSLECFQSFSITKEKNILRAEFMSH